MVNSIDGKLPLSPFNPCPHPTHPDFCLWAPPTSNTTISTTEGSEVAWCTKPGRGTRQIPPTSLTGVQFIKTPDYIQVVGFINQEMINMVSGDAGGELDPHGADLVSWGVVF